MLPTNRSEFEQYCLRQLGGGVLEINMSPEQIADCIDDAITYWHTFHLDASEKRYVPYIVTDEDEKNGYLTIDLPILAVVSCINVGGWSEAQGQLGNPVWHMKMDIYAALGFAAGGTAGAFRFAECPYGRLTNYIVNMERLQMYNVLFNQAPRCFYYQHSNHLFIDEQDAIKAGEVIVLEAYVAINPDNYRDCWSDIWLKRYATARLGRLWGQVLSKYASVQLPGGITLDGPSLYQKYDEQIKELEQEIRSVFEYPPMFQLA